MEKSLETHSPRFSKFSEGTYPHTPLVSGAFGACHFALNILCLQTPFNETQLQAWLIFPGIISNFGPLLCQVQQKQRTGYWPLFRCWCPTHANHSVSLWVSHQSQPDLQSSEFVTTLWMTIFTIPPPVVLNRGRFVDDNLYSPNPYC